MADIVRIAKRPRTRFCTTGRTAVRNIKVMYRGVKIHMTKNTLQKTKEYINSRQEEKRRAHVKQHHEVLYRSCSLRALCRLLGQAPIMRHTYSQGRLLFSSYAVICGIHNAEHACRESTFMCSIHDSPYSAHSLKSHLQARGYFCIRERLMSRHTAAKVWPLSIQGRFLYKT